MPTWSISLKHSPDWKPDKIIAAPDIAAYLSAHHDYFNRLPAAWQRRFVERVLAFVSSKQFDGQNGFAITPAVELSIAASAVQLTLGLETWDLSYFRSILVFEADYRSPSTGKLHKGETNMGGFLCFSWKAFQEGNAIPHDKINLGLHEFAHALRFNGFKDDARDYFFEHYFARWQACADGAYHQVKHSIPGSIFRKYGGVNIEEFFSVTVETFFESPQEFKAALPDLYHHTAILLNQTFSDDGAVKPGCREELLAAGEFRLSMDYARAWNAQLRYKSLIFLAGAFLLGSGALMVAIGADRILPYACLMMGLATWIVFERKEASAIFRKDHLLVKRGFTFAKSYTVSYAQLVSLNLTGASTAELIYYYERFFYKEVLEVRPVQPLFEQLCLDLKQAGVAVKTTA